MKAGMSNNIDKLIHYIENTRPLITMKKGVIGRFI